MRRRRTWGSTAARSLDEPAEKSRVPVKVHTALAKKILYGLVEREFDVANLGKMQPLGNPDRGMSHMMMYPHPYLIPNNDIPCIAIMLNEYHLPLPTANRCWQLGRALAALLPEVLIGLGPEQFAAMAARALAPKPIEEVAVGHLHLQRVSVREQAGIVVDRLRRARTLTFRSLVADCDTTLLVIGRFLALLEQVRGQAPLADRKSVV